MFRYYCGLWHDAEWNKDGEYYHYLTKWLQALSKLFVVTGDRKFLEFGVELVDGVHSRFTYSRGTRKRMFWKMSIDLSRPLVPSMGHHDPLDGFITYYQLDVQLPPNSLKGSMEVFECEPASSLSRAEKEATRRAENNAEERVIDLQRRYKPLQMFRYY